MTIISRHQLPVSSILSLTAHESICQKSTQSLTSQPNEVPTHRLSSPAKFHRGNNFTHNFCITFVSLKNCQILSLFFEWQWSPAVIAPTVIHNIRLMADETSQNKHKQEVDSKTVGECLRPSMRAHTYTPMDGQLQKTMPPTPSIKEAEA